MDELKKNYPSDKYTISVSLLTSVLLFLIFILNLKKTDFVSITISISISLLFGVFIGLACRFYTLDRQSKREQEWKRKYLEPYLNTLSPQMYRVNRVDISSGSTRMLIEDGSELLNLEATSVFKSDKGYSYAEVRELEMKIQGSKKKYIDVKLYVAD